MRSARFVLVGALCALLNNLAVIVLVHRGLDAVLASLVAFGPVLIVGYALHVRFTFRTTASGRSFLKYTAANAANFPLWVVGLYLLCDLMRLSIGVAGSLLTLLIFAWNYLAARWTFLGGAAKPVTISRGAGEPVAWK